MEAHPWLNGHRTTGHPSWRKQCELPQLRHGRGSTTRRLLHVAASQSVTAKLRSRSCRHRHRRPLEGLLANDKILLLERQRGIPLSQ